MLYILWKIEVFSFKNWQNHIEKFKWVIPKWRIWSLRKSYYPPTMNIFQSFFNVWAILLSSKILCERFLMLSVMKFDLLWYKCFLTNLCSPNIWDYRDKISLWNIETGRGITFLMTMYRLNYWSFFIGVFFKNDIIKYIIKVILCIVL